MAEKSAPPGDDGSASASEKPTAETATAEASADAPPQSASDGGSPSTAATQDKPSSVFSDAVYACDRQYAIVLAQLMTNNEREKVYAWIERSVPRQRSLQFSVWGRDPGFIFFFFNSETYLSTSTYSIILIICIDMK